MITIWRVSLDAAESFPPARTRCLDAHEARRAERFVSPAQAARWRMVHVALRELLGASLALAPEEVPLVHHADGRTTLDADLPLRFSLSHTADLALVAVGTTQALGVDLEQSRSIPGFADVLGDVFTPAEREVIAALPADEAQWAFLRGWTRKEAVVKALGRGIGAMAKVEVTLEPAVARLVAIALAGERPAEWALADLQLAPPFVGALAVRGPSAHYELRDWTIS